MHIHGFIYIYFCYLSLKQRNLEMRTLIWPQRITKYLYVYSAIETLCYDDSCGYCLTNVLLLRYDGILTVSNFLVNY